MKVRNSILLGSILLVTLCIWGCDLMYPTEKFVKTLNDANLEYQGGLQGATIETMTAQHTAMTPELEAVFTTLLAQNQELSASLKSLAADKASTISGPDLGGITSGGGIIDWIFNALGLGWLLPVWNMFFGKSRASSEIADMKLKLAARAGEGDDGL